MAPGHKHVVSRVIHELEYLHQGLYIMCSTKSSTVPSCSLCARLLYKSGGRRMLYTATSSHIWTALGQIAVELFPGNIETLFPCRSYLCDIPCFHAVEKLLKLRESVSEEEEKLRDKLYKCSSGMDQGTLYHLQYLINRRNVVKNVTSSVANSEEFFLLVVVMSL